MHVFITSIRMGSMIMRNMYAKNCRRIMNKRMTLTENLKSLKVFFLNSCYDCFVNGAQEQLWTDALPDTTNDPEGS